MSNTAVINVKTDAEVKREAQFLASELGFSLSSVINSLLRQFVRTRRIEVEVAEEPSEYLIQALKESAEDVKAGRVSPAFDNVEDAIKWLNDPREDKYENSIQREI